MVFPLLLYDAPIARELRHGFKGRLAHAFGKLMMELWTSDRTSISPKYVQYENIDEEGGGKLVVYFKCGPFLVLVRVCKKVHLYLIALVYNIIFRTDHPLIKFHSGERWWIRSGLNFPTCCILL